MTTNSRRELRALIRDLSLEVTQFRRQVQRIEALPDSRDHYSSGAIRSRSRAIVTPPRLAASHRDLLKR
jgi:hypothetical protein